jgi:alanine racemase
VAPLRSERRAAPAEVAGEAGPPLRPAWAEVDLDALVHNLELLRRRVAPARVMGIVKADAYGHGAPAVARALERAGIDGLGVALVEEGVELRRAGVELPILVLGSAQAPQLALFRRHRLTATIGSAEQLRLWREAAPGAGEAQPVHLKVDTGMTRLGVPLAAAGEALAAIREHPGLRLEGLLSHLAEAEDLASPHAAAQEARFAALLGELGAATGGVVRHLANSAAALHRPATRYDLVRAGLALYGLDPVEREAGLRPAMAVRARVVVVREVPAGTRLGYGGVRSTARPSRLAVVPVGYADGYPWRLSDRAAALVGGTRVPVAGNVSMDMTLLDVTAVETAVGDEVVLLGRQGSGEIGAGELARLAGTIPYEILCGFGLRLPRRYWREGRVAEQRSRFAERE